MRRHVRSSQARTLAPAVITSALALVILAGGATSSVPHPEMRTTTLDDNAGIPAFARKYGISCSVCHAPAPRLTEMGEDFAENGFHFSEGEIPRDTIQTGDPDLRLMRDIPLAIRLDLYAQARTNPGPGQASTDLQTPWMIKLLSGGQIADDVSYYLYFFMSERGEVKGLEDAYVQFTNVGGSGVSVLAGQYQVSDPLFKRELRLEYEDYQAYRVRVGEARADLTYDRGLMFTYSPWNGGDASFQIVNGQGLDEASSSRLFDRDSGKNVVLRLSQDFGPVRLGAFGYFGRESAAGERDDIVIWGPDLTIPIGQNIEINAQYLRRTDDNPFFVANPTSDDRTVVDAGFVELLWAPRGFFMPWTFSALYNVVSADDRVVSLRVGENDLIGRYRSLALGANYQRWRNVRFTGEVAWDFEREQARLTVGAMTAF